jgi:hypothetical protein
MPEIPGTSLKTTAQGRAKPALLALLFQAA